MDDLIQNIVNRQFIEREHILSGKLVPRLKLPILQDALKSPLIKVIVGPRRAGKSTIAMQALQQHRFAYLNFEDERLPTQIDGDLLVSALKKKYGSVDYYFFDEIQNMNRWQPMLNRLHRMNLNIIVTGSNAQMLSEELSTALTGRHIEIEILPFCFKEVCNLGYSIESYLHDGGFPEIALSKSPTKPYLSALWDAIILKDIAKRKRIRNLQALGHVLELFLSNMTSSYNIDSIARALGGEASAPTIKKFISYGIEAYLISSLRAYSKKPKTRIKSDRKAYIIDNGFFSSRHVSLSENKGVLLENAVFNELRARDYTPNKDLFYYKTRANYEIDFLLRHGHETTELIQVCHSLSTLKARKREYRALELAAVELDASKLTIITSNETRRDKLPNDRYVQVIAAEDWFKGDR